LLDALSIVVGEMSGFILFLFGFAKSVCFGALLTVICKVFFSYRAMCRILLLLFSFSV